MNPTAPSRVNPPLLVALGLTCLFAIATGAPQSIGRTATLVAKIIWLYLANARG